MRMRSASSAMASALEVTSGVIVVVAPSPAFSQPALAKFSEFSSPVMLSARFRLSGGIDSQAR